MKSGWSASSLFLKWQIDASLIVLIIKKPGDRDVCPAFHMFLWHILVSGENIRCICINLKFGIMRNLNCHIRHICHTAVYALELQRVAMVTDSVTDTVTDFCQSCTYATASFYMHDVGSFTQWNSLFRPVEQIVSC